MNAKIPTWRNNFEILSFLLVQVVTSFTQTTLNSTRVKNVQDGFPRLTILRCHELCNSDTSTFELFALLGNKIKQYFFPSGTRLRGKSEKAETAWTAGLPRLGGPAAVAMIETMRRNNLAVVRKCRNLVWRSAFWNICELTRTEMRKHKWRKVTKLF